MGLGFFSPFSHYIFWLSNMDHFHKGLIDTFVNFVVFWLFLYFLSVLSSPSLFPCVLMVSFSVMFWFLSHFLSVICYIGCLLVVTMRFTYNILRICQSLLSWQELWTHSQTLHFYSLYIYFIFLCNFLFSQ